MILSALASAGTLVLAACGAISLPSEGAGTGGTSAGGPAGTGGAGSGGGSGTGGAIPSGGYAGTGGSVATGGAAGSSSSTDAGAGCAVGPKVYPNGATGIPAPNGCADACTCRDGALVCSGMGCPPAQVCGGLRGLACPKGSYCQFPPSAQCGAADQTGECKTSPTMCTKIFAPVCGCDDKTYGNACEAAAAGVSVAHDRACAPTPGSCTVGDVSYPDGTGNIPAADGCNICSCNAGALRCTLRACPAPMACGARAGNTCTANEYCAYTEGGYCGAADAQSVCTPRPMACPDIYAPVCACDNKTYGNACSAAAGGSGVLHSGPCTGTGRSCVVGGVTYPDGSQKIPSGDGCNNCGCTDGQLTCTLILCPTPGICGGFAGFTCKTGEYCAFAEGQNCGAADASAMCAQRPEICPTIFAPVCACDGKTYGNACEAARAGFGVNRTGPCPI